MTYEPGPSSAAITAESRKLLEQLGRAIRQATPERTQEWERRIERVLEDGRALIDAAELGERVERAMVERQPMRRFALVGGCRRSTADEFKAAHDDGSEPPEAA